ncbi:MAG: ABC transporter permease [Chitinispirillales bacterium]|jgi:ABC-type lipoprotein release transport system permease subunit|nr:ABC transporter permease [Chitinispirillales bacterium]
MMNLSKNSIWNLARRNFVFYLRKNILFAAGCAVSAVVLIGALLIGTSLRESIRGLYLPRLGEVRWTAASSTGQFRESLADSIAARLAVKTAPVLLQTGSVGVAGKNERAHRVNIIGVDERFWELGGSGGNIVNKNFDGNSAIVNSALAEKLGIDSGSQIILRFQTTGTLAMDAPFGLQENLSTLRLPVTSIASRDRFGDFSLRAEHFTVYNVFVPLALLQSVNETPEMASAVLIGESASITGGQIVNTIQKSLSIRDAGLNLRSVNNVSNGNDGTNGNFEIYSDNIFISEPLKNIITDAIPQAIPVSAWFVNSINRLNGAGESTPYSFISTPPVNNQLKDDQIALTAWTASDLNASIGDSVTLVYFVPRPVSGLRVDTSTFIVSSISQDTAAWLNRSLMPPYPGLADAGSCTDWNPSIPVDLSKIRPEDEDYWEEYGGTPKAVISYEKAARIWGNRFGASTAIRISNNAIDGGNITIDGINAAVLPSLTPAICGIRLTDIRANIDDAVNSGIDFAPLFAGLSFFTFAASLMLIWLLSTLQVKSRAEEHKILVAAGYSRKHILQIYLSEGFIIFSIGCTAGILLAPLYTLAIIKALKTVWHAAAQTPEISLHIEILPIIYGSAAAFACALIAMLIPILSQTKGKRRASAQRVSLRRASIRRRRTSTQTFTSFRLVLSNIRRERKRAIGEAAILACALIILGTTQMFHSQPPSDPRQRSSGTGGFFWYGELNSGIPYEETTAQFLRERGIDVGDENFLSVNMRVKDGDDASCLNLNQARTPVLLGANHTLLDSTGAFSFASMISAVNKNHPWQILGSPAANSKTIYAIADANTIEWGLGKSLGDSLVYINELGDTLNVILAAALRSSVLQGKIVIAESDFIRHYPSISGYRLLLLSPPPGREKIIADAFRSYHDKSGLQLESTAERLTAFNAVENTYLSIFALLGMMGLMLGCAGMGIVVLRNIEERQSEFALLMVHGFTVSKIKRLLFAEHTLIALAGTLAGLLPAFLVSISAAEVNIPTLLRIASLLAIVLSCGIGSIALGLRGLRLRRGGRSA